MQYKIVEKTKSKIYCMSNVLNVRKIYLLKYVNCITENVF